MTRPVRRFVVAAAAGIALAALAAMALRRAQPPQPPAPGPAQAPSAAAAEWERRWDLALAEAQLRGVDLLLCFRNRAWGEAGPWQAWADAALCREVLGDAALRDELQERFAIVELDYDPSAPLADLPPELARFGAVACSVGFRGAGPGASPVATSFPVAVLADAEGRPYALRAAMAPGAADAHKDDLLAACSIRARRDDAFARAESAVGGERARALAEGLLAIDAGLLAIAYQDELHAVVQADADGDAGLRDRFERLLRTAELRSVLLLIDGAALAAGADVAPRRLRELLDGFPRAHPSIVEVQQAVRFWAAAADARVAFDERGFAAIEQDLAAAKVLAPESCVAARCEEALAGVAALRAAARK